MNPYRLVPFILLSFSFFGAKADPVIEDFKLNSDEGYIEIFGSGFGDKPNAKPLLWLDFESGIDFSLSRTELSIDDINGKIVSDPDNLDNSVLIYDAKGNGSGGPEDIEFDSDKLFISVKRYYNFDIDDPELTGSSGGLNLKVLRLWASYTSPDINNIYLGYQGTEGNNSGRIYAEYTGQSTNWVGSTAPQKGFDWLNEEVIYEASNIDAQNGIFQYIRNGKYAKSTEARHRTSDRPKRYGVLVFDQVSNYSLSSPLEIMYDDIYVDESYHRLVLTDSKSADKYSESVIQIPIEWSDTYIKAKVRTKSINNGNQYLHVYDGKNVSTAEGLRFCPECPVAPIIP